jgi:hypothetical protein
MAQALRDYSTVPTSATGARPFDQLWRERVTDPLSGDARSAMAGRPPRVGASAQPIMSRQAADDFYDRVGMPPASEVPGRAPQAPEPDRFIEKPPAAPGRLLGLDAGQPTLTAPTVTAGSFSPVPDYVGVKYPKWLESRVPKRIPGSIAQQRVALKGAMAPEPVPREPPPVDVPESLPRLSRPRNVDNLSSAQLSAGVPAYVPAQYRAIIGKAAIQYDLPPALLARQIHRESRFNPNALGPLNEYTRKHGRAEGISQFMPATSRGMRLRDPYDPEQAIPAQAALLRRNIDGFGSVALGLAAYNSNPTTVSKYVAGRGRLPAQTVTYVEKILGVLLPEYYTPQPPRP